jgi:hypothetical protein
VSRVTRRVGVDDLPDLLAAPPRACLAYRDGAGVQAAPVGFRFESGRYLVAPGTGPRLGDLVELLVDDGKWFFDLRGLRVRGRLAEAADPGWYELVPDKVVAWDYGTLHRTAGDGPG